MTRVGFLATTAAAAIALAVPAGAGGGTATEFKLDDRTFDDLAAATVAVQPLGSTEETDGGFAFPVRAAKIGENSAQVWHRGGLAFQSGAGELKLKHLRVRIVTLGSRGTLTARTADGRVRLADVTLTHTEDVEDRLIPAKAKLELAGEGDKALTKALGIEFDKGLPLGKLRFHLR